MVKPVYAQAGTLLIVMCKTKEVDVTSIMPYSSVVKKRLKGDVHLLAWNERWLDDRRWVIGDRRVTSKEHRGWASFGNVMVATTDIHNGAR
uniref:Uncharacterized protein n=1 Tax=Oryza glumipatula TaxID=40148 RepID=A0A0E0BTU7_9ORYZ